MKLLTKNIFASFASMLMICLSGMFSFPFFYWWLCLGKTQINGGLIAFSVILTGLFSIIFWAIEEERGKQR